MLPWVIVVVCSSLLEAWELSTAEELATEEEAVIGEFSVVLSVGMPMLELVSRVKVNVVDKYTVELDSSVASELVTTSLLSVLGTGAEEDASEEEAVIGEFSVVLSVGSSRLELRVRVNDSVNDGK